MKNRILASALLAAIGTLTLPLGALAAFIIFSTFAPLAPSVTGVTFSTSLPLTNGETLGTVAATQNPTSWAITSCAPTCGGYFAISSSGVVTVTSSGVSGATATTYSLGVSASNSAGAGSATVLVSVAPLYSGIVDLYPSSYWAEGFSVYAPTAAYSGNFAQIERTNDNTTTIIGYDSSHRASVSQFNAFCAGTYCYVKTLYDSFGQTQGHENDWVQNTLAKMPQMAVAADGMLEVCGAPASSMANAYANTQSAAQLEMFAVAYAATLDWNGFQPNLPYFTFTGNTSTAAQTITGITEAGVAQTFQGLSLYNGWNATYNYTVPINGIQDVTHPNAFWWEQFPNNSGGFTLGGTTITMNGYANDFLTETGDTFQITNAVQSGPWFVIGPSSATYQTSAYAAFGMTNANGIGNGLGGDTISTKNGATNEYTVIGQYMRGRWAVWDYDTSTEALYHDTTLIYSGNAASNVTYGTNVGMTLFSDASGAENTVNQCFHQMAFVNTVASNRATIDASLDSQFSITPIATTVAAQTTADGFTLQPELLAPYPSPGYSAVLGDNNYNDVNGINWQPQSGGYLHSEGPGMAYATNVTQGACAAPKCPTLVQAIVNGGDSDTGISQHPRSEILDGINSGNGYPAGTHLSLFYEFKVKQMGDLTNTGGEWCYINQWYYGGGIDCLDRTGAGGPTLRPQIGGNDCGTVYPATGHITPGDTVYAVEAEFYVNGTSGSWSIYGPAPIGGTLALNCSGTGNVLASGTTLSLKQGLYMGDVPWKNTGGIPSPQDNVVQIANFFVSTTSGTFSSLVSAQPAWPTHP